MTARAACGHHLQRVPQHADARGEVQGLPLFAHQPHRAADSSGRHRSPDVRIFVNDDVDVGFLEVGVNEKTTNQTTQRRLAPLPSVGEVGLVGGDQGSEREVLVPAPLDELAQLLEDPLALVLARQQQSVFFFSPGSSFVGLGLRLRRISHGSSPT